jgi:shikimate kinase
VGTLNRFLERNIGTARATYPAAAYAAIASQSTGLPASASLETVDGMGDMHASRLIMDARSPLSLPRTVALVGLMGAGKSAIGKRLAQRLGLPFVDADDEIERAAGCSIGEIFEKYGEADFRAGERRVISRLLDEPPHVLSTGGGAYVDPSTRTLMRTKAVTVWLRAELDVLLDRVRKRGHRPLLRGGDPKEVLSRLMTQRYPIYAEADIIVDSTAQPADRTTDQVIEALRTHLQAEKTPA